jgi:hypothetical protein
MATASTDTMTRLRRYVGSRAKRTESAKIEEGKALLAPLLDALKKLNAEAAARATIKKNKAASSSQPGKDGASTTAAPAPAAGSSTPAPAAGSSKPATP